MDANLLRAEAAYRLAVLLLDRKEWQQAIQCADMAITCFSKLVQHEHQLAWCHQVKAMACDAQGDEAGTLASRREAERLLVLWGQDQDRFRVLLAQALEADSDEDWTTWVKEAEHSAFSLGAEARIVWSVAIATHYAAKGDRTAALEHVKQGILLENDVETWIDAQAPVFLHQLAAELFAKEGHRFDALAHAQAAYSSDASDYWIALLLAMTQFNAGYLDDVDNTIDALDRLGAAQPNWQATRRSLQIAMAVKRNDPRTAATIAAEAFRETNNNTWAEWRDELSDIDKGVRTFAQSDQWTPLWERGREQAGDYTENRAAITSLPDSPWLTGVAFYDDVLIKTAHWLLENQGNELSSIRDYWKETNSLLERHFRDAYRNAISMEYRGMRTEEYRTRGPSDLVVPSTDESLRKVRFEFKIWGREHVGTVTQLLSYMSDEEDIGIVYMINSSKRNIADAYREEMILLQPDYKSASFREWPVLPEATGFRHFRSIHRTISSREITVYHFIHNFSG